MKEIKEYKLIIGMINYILLCNPIESQTTFKLESILREYNVTSLHFVKLLIKNLTKLIDHLQVIIKYLNAYYNFLEMNEKFTGEETKNKL